jgi:hypothetical protein
LRLFACKFKRDKKVIESSQIEREKEMIVKIINSNAVVEIIECKYFNYAEAQSGLINLHFDEAIRERNKPFTVFIMQDGKTVDRIEFLKEK